MKTTKLIKGLELWCDEKANKKKIEDLEDVGTHVHEALYNLTEDIICLKEQVILLESKLAN